ncbi:hypothetical protein VKT23_001550 [Stygiomarasmius scandens]|uniref:Protein YOP1 n=1 Tax=Marasmiellus scandens TaxID=2682957 RepID=A0ABR1JZJ9_9AGAR
MPLFSPLLRLFMVFLNVWDTFKTLKDPPSKYRRGPEGEFYGPSARAVVQRKRDMKGCLAIWIVWCCFVLYERFIEPFMFIPFYDEFKSIAILFFILTRARGAEPIFLHVIRPFLRPYNMTIDTSLELARMIGDMLFALVILPLGFLQPYIHTYAPWLKVPFSVEHHAEIRREERMEVVAQNGRVQSYVEETRIYESHTSQHQVIPPEFFGAEHPRPLSEPALQQSYPYLHPSATMSMPNPTHFSNSAPPTPDEIDADMEWRQYAPLPSAYPPTPLVGHSAALPPKRPISMGFDAVPENEEDERQDFDRSLLPPREPLNPGSGKRGLSDNDNGVNVTSSKNRDAPENGPIDDNDTGMDEDMESGDEGSDEDYVDEDEEDDFNITLRTPRAPLALNPQSGSTIRTRASARSLVAELGRSRQSFLSPPALETPSISGESVSTRLSTNDDDSSLRTRTVDARESRSYSDSELSASPSVSVSDVSDMDDDRPAFVPNSTLDSPTRNELKRSYSRSFSPERTLSQLPSSRQRQNVADDLDEANVPAPANGHRGRLLERLSSTSQESVSSAIDEPKDSGASGINAVTLGKDDKVAEQLRNPTIPKGAWKSNAGTIRAAGKRRKTVDKSLAVPEPPTAEGQTSKTSLNERSRKRSTTITVHRKLATVAASGFPPSPRRSNVKNLAQSSSTRSIRSSSRLRSSRSVAEKKDT